MKNLSLPKILQLIASLSLVLGSVTLIFLVVFILLAGFGIFAGDSSGLSFGTSLSWPVTFQLEPDSYSLQGENLGVGEIQLAHADVNFGSADLGSIGIGIEVALWILLVGIPILAILFNLYLLFGSMEKGTPFLQQNVGRIRWIAGLVIFYSIVFEVATARIAERLFFGIQAEGLEIVYRMNVNVQLILVGLIIFALAEVFRYGLELQIESDLTV